MDHVRADWKTAQCVETGVQVSLADGVTEALEFMLESGVPRQVAVRVLSAPRFIRHRRRDGAKDRDTAH